MGDISQPGTDLVLDFTFDARGVLGEAERVQNQGGGERSGRSEKESDGSKKSHFEWMMRCYIEMRPDCELYGWLEVERC